ncbi:phosphatidylinositol-glycan biosynthesis class S protein [Catenaria anguillulae PL171]|uniref:Phosphatidylinositol-glycan biosynthesis class S protein n=1 Tax=Catenaria anguillulae PL171 TaxID=765915 RepID=A0A1Y2GZ54_9FUNG|nr:phosphatidylinositol-glycan biosynthesis class S protein [Catenaria anguillulae PL171]
MIGTLDVTRRQQRTILAAYLTAFVIGIPYWWKITTIPRAALPNRDISNLAQQTDLHIPLTFAWDPSCSAAPAVAKWPPSPGASAISAEAVQDELNAQWTDPTRKLVANPSWTLTAKPRVIAHDPQAQAAGSAVIARVCAISVEAGGENVRAVKVATNGAVGIVATKASDVASALAALATHLAAHMANPPKSMHFSHQYEILLSLMIQNPAATPIRTWSIEPALHQTLSPLLTHLLGNPHRFKLVTQIQYLADPGEGVDLPVPPTHGAIYDRIVKDPETGEWIEKPAPEPPVQPVRIPMDQLPLFVNPDWNLESVTPNHSAVHLITYVPDPRTPMWVLDEAGSEVEGNAFLLPRWGGVVVRNMQRGTKTVEEAVVMDLSRAWVAHLRELFGVSMLRGKVTVNGHRIEFPSNSATSITATEITMHHLSQYAVHISEASATLQALIRLTDSQDNLPISRKIAALVKSSLATVQVALDPTADTAMSVLDRFQKAWDARREAELAFFDSEMVGLAYFPSEHTYAVYMPLFVPVFVTVLVVVVKEAKLMRAKK